MRSIFDRGAGPTALTLLLLWIGAVPASMAEPLTLDDAWRLAVERDAGREAVESEAAAMRERSVAAGSLPDPEARIGAVNLPVDSFDLDAQDMTMLEVGVMQRFPAGQTRTLSQARYESEASGLDAQARDRALEARLEVERAWRQLDYLDQLSTLLDGEARWIGALVDGAGAAYAAGAGGQLELVDARLMALEVEERRLGLERERDGARAELARWIGQPAYGERRPAPPATEGAAPLAELLARLQEHPRIEALDRQREAAERDVDLAAERYKPSFGVDVAYGFRQGRGMSGADRPDMLTAMLTFDVPLFTGNRQDREADAARAGARAAQARRTDLLREMEARLRAAHARAGRLGELVELYDSEIRRLADVSVEAALAAYRSSDGSLADVVNTERRVLDLRDRVARARLERALALAEIDYLTGDLP
jgi:outer membrane protein TolC